MAKIRTDKSYSNKSMHNVPDTIRHDELDEYLIYQDRVMERNAQEFNDLLEEQDEKIDNLQELQDISTAKVYEIEDPLNRLSNRMQDNLDKLDSQVGERTTWMNDKTEEYTRYLQKKNSEWKNKLDDMSKTLADNATQNREGRWKERQEQKSLNKGLKEKGKVDDLIPEIWVDDSGTKIPVERERSMYQDQRERQKTQRRSSKPISRSQEEHPSTRPRTKARGHVHQKQKEVSRPTNTGQRQQNTQTGTTSRQTTSRTSSVKNQKETYPCPVCNIDLKWYPRYQRWWCTSCKKWR